jgi:adenylosuccinate lyase
MEVWEDIQNAIAGDTFREKIEADSQVKELIGEGKLDAAKLDAIFDPRAFLTRIDAIFDRLETLEF